MSKFQLVYDIFIISLAIVLGVSFVVEEVSLETQYIPTVINGIATAVSLTMGFMGTIIAITLPSTKVEKERRRVLLYLAFSILTITLLFQAYVQLFKADYQGALKLAMGSLIISSYTLMNLLSFIAGILPRL